MSSRKYIKTFEKHIYYKKRQCTEVIYSDLIKNKLPDFKINILNTYIKIQENIHNLKQEQTFLKEKHL